MAATHRVKRIVVQGDRDANAPFLTSGFQPPQNCNMLDAWTISAGFQAFASGGSILHNFIGGNVPVESKIRMIKVGCNEFPISQFTLSPVATQCCDCGTRMIGEYHECEKCKSTSVMVMGRIVGYMRPIYKGAPKVDSDNLSVCADRIFWQKARIADWGRRTLM